MDRKRVLIAIAVIAAIVIAVYVLTLSGGQAPPGFIKQYSDEACNQTAFGCAQEKLLDTEFDCTDLCQAVCSPEMMEKCIHGDFY